MGVLQHILTISPGERQTRDMLIWIRWSLREEAKLLPPFDGCPTPNHKFLMNIIVWNYRGSLKPSFQKHVHELVHNHNPVILVVMETRIGGERAKEIIDLLPFDGVVHMETIGYANGHWML